MPRRRKPTPPTSAPRRPARFESLEPRLLLDGADPQPAAPSDLAVAAAGYGWVDLAWQDHADNETGYRIDRVQVDGLAAGDWQELDVVGPNVTRWRDADIYRGVTYAYRVAAVGEASFSAPTDPVEAVGAWPFVPVALGLPLVEGGEVAWADFDGDGDQDVVLTGAGRYGDIAEIYRNDGGVFLGAPGALPAVSNSAAAWGDYDADGDLDLVLNGQGAGFHAAVFRNDGGHFMDLDLPLTGGAWGDVAWVDYDADGDLDAVLFGSSGADATVEVCRNEGGGFSILPSVLPAVLNAAVAWGDYDADGDADALVTGRIGADNIARIYRNNGGGAFVDIGADLEGARDGSAEWGDFDGDGDLDALVAGRTVRGQYARVYENRRGTFRPLASPPDGIPAQNARWADYDTDGDLDILAHTSVTDLRLWVYDGTSYAQHYALPASEGAWGDFNGDGYPDVSAPEAGPDAAQTLVYRNVQMPSAVLTAGRRTWQFDTLDGGRATVRLSGPGRAELRKDPFGELDLASIVLYGTTEASSLTVTVNRARSTVTAGDLSVYGSVRDLAAKALAVSGSVTITGLARRVHLAGLADDHRLEINTYHRPVGPRDKVYLTLGCVADAAIETNGMPIAALKVVEWLDAGGDDVIHAPWIGTLTATGRRARPAYGIDGSAGDFEAGLSLTGAARNGRAIGGARVSGAVAGAWDLTAETVGYVGAVRAGAADGWDLAAPAVRVVGVTVGGDLVGQLEAFRFGWITARGGVSASISATGATRGGVSIGRFTGGTVHDTELVVAGGISSVRVAEWLEVDGGIDDRPDRINAAWVSYLRTVGRRARPASGIEAADGDFEAALDLDVTAAPKARRYALYSANIRGTVRQAVWDLLGRAGTLRVRGDWADSTCYVDGPVGRVVVLGTAESSRIACSGRINAILLGASVGSDFLVGVSGPVDPDTVGLYDVDVASRIGSIRVQGWRLPRDQAGRRFVLDTQFVAASVGTVVLTNAAGVDSYEFILLGGQGHIRSLRHFDRTDRDQSFTWRPGRPYPDQWLGATPWDVL